MIKVVYDISVLGIGHRHTRARTGIFRVVENLARGLAHSVECDLRFCAPHQLSYTHEYLETANGLKDMPLISKEIKRQVESAMLQTNSEANDVTGLRKIPNRVKRRTLSGLNKTVNVFFAREEYRAVAEADIFHSPFYPFPAHLKRFNHTKKFLTIYDLIPLMFPQFFEFSEDHLLKAVVNSIDETTWVTCISQATKNDLCNQVKSLDPERVTVTHLAASELFYCETDSARNTVVKNKYNLPDAPYILSLSTLEPRKNIAQTIRSFARLVTQESITDLYLVLVGAKGWNYDSIFAAIEENEALRKRIIVTGYVDDDDLASLYSGALAFVYPSFYEGFGLPPLEAMQCGVPVITSNTSSLPEVVGDAGIMVDPHDTDALCQSMLDLYTDSRLRAALKRKSIERAKQFSWDKCVQQTIRAYRTASDS
ncbi:MAG: glycosyltransferase family 4 protein [Pyrinomonadaceae bacterium MAG19_C2-C3]|nr:glycosyltransferase family 4 protein [Pyrinomonadaceae bacterium MAG19_C2-C3]